MAIFTISNGMVTRDLGNIEAVGYNYIRHKENKDFKYDCISVDTKKFKRLFIEFGVKGLYLDYINLVFSKAYDFHNLKRAIQVRFDISYANICRGEMRIRELLKDRIQSAFRGNRFDGLDTDRCLVINTPYVNDLYKFVIRRPTDE